MTPGSVNSIVENIGKIFVESANITFDTFCLPGVMSSPGRDNSIIRLLILS
jgi:hypothetical protein